jgi:predicted dehydrogenase
MKAYNTSRRQFLYTTSLATVASLTSTSTLFAENQEEKKIRLAFIGVGLRGRDHLAQSLYRSDVEVVAINDIDPDALAKAQDLIVKASRKKAVEYGKGEKDFENLLKRGDLDAVIIATPWQWHVPQAVAAMKAGVYVGLEVPAALTVKECWELVKTYEKTGTHLMFLENVCYRRDVMAVLNMVRKGLFGELLHTQCGYQHDLRAVKFNDGKQYYGGGVEFGEKAISEAHWRTQHSVERNGDLYPTHGLGPIAQMLNINRGNHFLHLSSYATKSGGLHNYIVEKGGENHPNSKVNFKLGDVITTLIKCANGETIMISHDTNLPRPYSLGFRVQGSKGIWMDDNKSIYLEGISPKAHTWEAAKPYLDKHDHPLWQQFEKEAENAGHGGMDFFVLKEFLDSVKAKIPPPIDVYDAATWSVISPLSEQSIAHNSASIPIPKFKP